MSSYLLVWILKCWAQTSKLHWKLPAHHDVLSSLGSHNLLPVLSFWPSRGALYCFLGKAIQVEPLYKAATSLIAMKNMTYGGLVIVPILPLWGVNSESTMRWEGSNKPLRFKGNTLCKKKKKKSTSLVPAATPHPGSIFYKSVLAVILPETLFHFKPPEFTLLYQQSPQAIAAS